MLTNDQRKMLLQPLKRSRVNQKQGMNYLEAFDVIAHLTRAFGFEGWDKEIIRLDLISDVAVTWIPKDRNGKPLPEKSGWNVCYRCALRLTVRDPEGNVVKTTEDVSVGAATHQPDLADAHDLALKSAVSGALKRCAKDLGDQFGLGLYDGGSVEACVKRVVIYPDISGLAEEAVTAGDGSLGSPTPPERSSAAPEAMSVSQRGKIFAMVKQYNLGEAHAKASEILGRPVEHLSHLSKSEAHKVIEGLNAIAAQVEADKVADSR